MANRIVPYVHTPDRTFEWWRYALAYLNAAEVIFQSTANATDQRPVDGLAPVGLPATYCVRHGVELLLKLLALMFGEPLAKTHDPVKLVARLEDPIRKLDREEVARVSRLLGCEVESFEKFPVALLRTVGDIAAKYYDYTSPGGLLVSDPQNELLRYPVSLETANLDIDRLPPEWDVASVLPDIKMLQSLLFVILGIWGKTSTGKSFLESLE